MRTVAAARYVTPLREGGSLPAVIDADDGGTYVVKFWGAGQGKKALIAELIAGEMARALGLPVPELVLVELDSVLGRNEPDSEIQALLKASAGLNLGLRYLPGAIAYDPTLGAPPLASEIVWFDALVANVDRTARNTNLLVWHKQLHLIDHGAALYYHHDWERFVGRSRDPFPAIRDHVLLPFAHRLAEADAALGPLLDDKLLGDIIAEVPEVWLEGPRGSYLEFFRRRLEAPRAFVEEALRAQHLDYAVVRVVPRPERGELVNAGVILYCRARDFLEARIALDRARLQALDPAIDVDEVERALAVFPQVCAGHGPIGALPLAERFHWLVAPRSTVVQVSPVHSGLCDDPAAAVEELLKKLVLP